MTARCPQCGRDHGAPPTKPLSPSSSVPERLRIGLHTVLRWRRHVVTLLKDGTAILAAVEETAEYEATARRLGYTDRGGLTAAEWMNREHDPLHSLLAEAKGLPYSAVLWAVGNGRGFPYAAAEEAEVLTIQAALNGIGEVPGGLRERAVRLLRRGEG